MADGKTARRRSRQRIEAIHLEKCEMVSTTGSPYRRWPDGSWEQHIFASWEQMGKVEELEILYQDYRKEHPSMEEVDMVTMESYRADPATHWPECWREPGHHACAVAEIERLRQAVPDERSERVLHWRRLSDLGMKLMADGRKEDSFLEAVRDTLGTWWPRTFTRQQVAAGFVNGTLQDHWIAQIPFPNPEDE